MCLPDCASSFSLFFWSDKISGIKFGLLPGEICASFSSVPVAKVSPSSSLESCWRFAAVDKVKSSVNEITDLSPVVVRKSYCRIENACSISLPKVEGRIDGNPPLNLSRINFVSCVYKSLMTILHSKWNVT